MHSLFVYFFYTRSICTNAITHDLNVNEMVATPYALLSACNRSASCSSKRRRNASFRSALAAVSSPVLSASASAASAAA